MYEAHITIDPLYTNTVKHLYYTGWKFHQIDGGSSTYLTYCNKNSNFLCNYMLDVVEKLEKLGIAVLRTEIKRIVWDSKTGGNEL